MRIKSVEEQIVSIAITGKMKIIINVDHGINIARFWLAKTWGKPKVFGEIPKPTASTSSGSRGADVVTLSANATKESIKECISSVTRMRSFGVGFDARRLIGQ